MKNSPQVIKVAFLISSFRIGGRERLTADVLRLLDREHFTPFLCVMYGGDLLEDVDGETVYAHLARFRGDVPGYSWRLWRILRRERPDVVVCISNRVDSWIGRGLAWLAGVPVRMLELHGVRVAGQPLLLPPDHLLRPITTHYPAINADIARQLRAAGIPAEKITLIINGVDTALFRPSDTMSRRAGRESLLPMLPPDAPLIGCVAGLRPEKNLGLLLDALAQLPAAHLILIGEGEERARLEAHIAGLGLGERVHLLGLRRDIAALMPLFDLLALTSTTEQTPLVLLEAAACGVPVVATRVGGIPQIVADGEAGLLVESGDVAGLVAALDRLLTDAELRAHMGAAGRARAEAEFSLQQAVRAREALFSRLLESR